MILLTIIAVGLLTLSSISHRLALYRDGRIVSEGPADQFSAEQVMAALTSQSQPS
jgi:ABC-type oligopeptide transport system ATPase subunit